MVQASWRAGTQVKMLTRTLSSRRTRGSLASAVARCREHGLKPADALARVTFQAFPALFGANVAAMARSGTRGKSAALPSPVPAASWAPGPSPAVIRRLLTSAAVVLAVVLLFLAYLHVSRTYAENSDESNDLLMAWDMLHGNVLLHGWYLSDVSFYTTELPQYAMLEHFLGLHADTAHVAAAMTYTLVVVLAALLARGTVSGRDAWPRMLLTAGIMFAPQLGAGVFILLLSLGHIGTAVSLMLTWLVIDRAGPGPGGSGGMGPPGRGGFRGVVPPGQHGR